MSMYLSKLTIRNFMSYIGPNPYEFDFGPACNYLVGNNNCGKSTIFFALEFLSDKRAKIPPYRPIGISSGNGRVSACFVADDKELFPKRFQKFARLLSNGQFAVEVKRDFNFNGDNVSTEKPSVYDTTSGKWIDIPDSAIAELISPTSIDALVDPSDYADFGTTKLLGQLFGSQQAAIEALDLWKEYKAAHEKLISDPSGLHSVFDSILEELNDSLASLFGGAVARFDFSHQGVKDFLKGGSVLVDDGDQETELGSKGSGLQKAFYMAVVQAYARYISKHPASRLDLCIDEPETWLHPKAQIQFGEAISSIAARQQVWIATHSPYIIQSYGAGRGDQLLIFNEQSATSRYRHVKLLTPHFGDRPSLAQISYEAFGVCGPEYHSELLGYIQAKSEIDRLDDLGNYLSSMCAKYGIVPTKTRCRVNHGNVTESEELLPIYIRNCIDHPEAKSEITEEMKGKGIDNEYDQDELMQSVHFLTAIIKDSPWLEKEDPAE